MPLEMSARLSPIRGCCNNCIVCWSLGASAFVNSYVKVCIKTEQLCELLLNTEPSTIALIYRSPGTPPPDNISLICTLDTIISRRSDFIVLGDFNCPKVNWASTSAPPNTSDSKLLKFCSDSLLHQCVLTPTRFRVNQHHQFLSNSHTSFPLSLFTLPSVNRTTPYFAGQTPLLSPNYLPSR